MDSELHKRFDNKLSIVQKANEIKRWHLSLDSKQLVCNSSNLLRDFDALTNYNKIDSNQIENLQDNMPAIEDRLEVKDWDKIVEDSRDLLAGEGYNTDSLSTYSFLSSATLYKIDDHLNRPLYERIPWDKTDFAVCALAGVLGGVLDLLVCTPKRFLHSQLADKNSWIGKKFEKIHSVHEELDGKRYFAPIDHQKSGVSGGGHHRGLSPGHDLFQFIEGIRQFKDGEFRTIDWRNGQPIEYISNLVSPNRINDGPPNIYIPLNLSKAIVAYSVHMFCDYFSSTSLPLPGIFNFQQNSDHVIRHLAQEYYQNGYHLRNLSFQMLPPIIITILISIYLWLKVKNIDNEDKGLQQKKVEMRCLALGISSAFNLGKVIISNGCQPLSIIYYLNHPQLIVFTKNILQLLILEAKRNDYTAKICRNVNELVHNNREIQSLIQKHMAASYTFSENEITEAL
jgi:hypothetical protein